MLLNTLTVTGMGVSQIVAGTAIELFSAGMMTHLGAAFISEGVSDLFFAVDSLNSGYFSWKDYGRHKLQSLIVTATTVGIGAWFSRGSKVSRFGYKLAGPNFEFGKNVAKMSGTKLIKATGCKVIGKEVAKRVISKSIEGVAFGLANVGVDTLVENHLKSLCESISSVILSDIKREVEKHNISQSLEKLYQVLGRGEAEKVIQDITQSVFTEKSYLEEFTSIANKIASSVTQGIGEAVKKRSKTSNALVLPINAISKIVVWSERSVQIAKIINITKNHLNNMDHEIKDRSDKLGRGIELNQSAGGDCESFKKKVIDQWKLLFHEKAGRIIAQRIVNPILKEGAHSLIRFVGKKMQESYRSHKESGYFERFEELKLEYKKNLQNEQQSDNRSKTDDSLTENYHRYLRKLMIKTKNPDLFADIVLENVPMDMTCVDACTRVVHEVLKKRGVRISGLSITVEGDGGIRQEFSSVSGGGETIGIPLRLKDNHFEFCESDTSGNDRGGDSKNNCLYEALSDALPGLGRVIAPRELRAQVADCIRHDERIRYRIRQGWHRLPLYLGAFGGAARSPSKVVHDHESSSYSEERDYADYLHRERSVPNHLRDRFTRFFRIGGMIQRCSELTETPRDRVLRGGASEYQDKNSKRGRDVHAAHVIRLRIFPGINDKIPEPLRDELINFLGHTQNVQKYGNEWHGVGGDVDRFQSRCVNELFSLDFKTSLTAEDASVIQTVKDAFLTVLDRHIDGTKLDREKKSELRELRTKITGMSVESLFEKGKMGYSGEGTAAYR